MKYTIIDREEAKRITGWDTDMDQEFKGLVPGYACGYNFGDVEVDLHLVIIEEHSLVVGIMSVLMEKRQGNDVFKQHGLSIEQKEVKHSVVDEVVLAGRFFFCEWCRNIS